MERVKSLARLTLVVLWRTPNEEDRRIWSKATTVGALKEQVHAIQERDVRRSGGLSRDKLDSKSKPLVPGLLYPSSPSRCAECFGGSRLATRRAGARHSSRGPEVRPGRQCLRVSQ